MPGGKAGINIIKQRQELEDARNRQLEITQNYKCK